MPVAYPRRPLVIVALVVLCGTAGLRAAAPGAAPRTPVADASASVLLRTPAGLKAASTSTARITLTWSNRHRRATRNRISWRRAGSSRWRGRWVRGATRRASLTKLRPGTRYLVAVKACRGTRCGPSDREWVRTRSAASPGTPGDRPTIAGCAVFPADNAFNRRVDGLPVHRNSDALIRSIGVADKLHPDFGSGQYGDYGIPVTVVPSDQARVPDCLHRLRGRERPGAVPDPVGRAGRGCT